MGEKVVVTGASGHVGHAVARVLLGRGYQVHLLLRSGEGPLTRRLAAAGARVHVLDLLADPAPAATALSGAAVLFHLAAVNTTSAADPDAVWRASVGLTEAVLRAAARAGVPTVVYTSSVVVLGRSSDPARPRTEEADLATTAESPYVRGKLAAEHVARAAQAAGRDVRIVYPSWVLGPDDPGLTPPHGLVLNYVRRGGLGPRIFYFDGGISVAHVAEVAAGHVAAWETGSPRGRYVLGGENVTFQRFYTLLARAAGRRPPGLRLPTALVHAGGDVAKVAFNLFGRQPPVSPAYLRAVVGRYSWYDSGRAERDLGYHVRPAEETLAGAVADARQRLAGLYALNLRVGGDGHPDRVGLEAGNPAAATPGFSAPSAPRLPARVVSPLLITGVPGWLGNRLVDVLVNGDRFGHRYPERPVRLLVHPSFRGRLELPARFEVRPGDLLDPTAMRDAVTGVGTVIHLAGAIYPPRVESLYEVNTRGTRNLVNACVERGVRRFLFMSTDSVCGHGTPTRRVFDETTPPSPYRHYGRSKWLAEEYVLEKTRAGQLDGTALRGFWFFGPYAPPRQLGFARMFASWPRQIVFGDGQNLRSVSHVDNVVQALLAAEPAPASFGWCYWVGDADGGYAVDTIYATLARAFGRPYRPFYVPRGLCTGLLGAADRLWADGFGRLQPTIHAVAKFPLDIAGRSDAAVRDFGYAPRVSLEDAARELAADFRAGA